MASSIDPSKPTAVHPTMKSVRDNFAAAKDEIEALQDDKQDALTAGAGITIVGNEISATGGGGTSDPTLNIFKFLNF